MPIGCISGAGGTIIAPRPGVWILSGGTYDNLPAVYTVSTSDLADIREKISDNTGADEEDIDLVLAALASASDLDFPTWAYARSTGNGFSWSSATSGSDISYRICEHTSSGEDNVADEVVEDGEVLLAKVTIDSVDYVVSLYVEEYTSSEWATYAETVQTDYWSDVESEMFTLLDVSELTPVDDCE